MTVQELIEALNKLPDKDLDLYVNVQGREFYINEIAYVDCNEVCFNVAKPDFPDDGTWWRFTADRLRAIAMKERNNK